MKNQTKIGHVPSIKIQLALHYPTMVIYVFKIHIHTKFDFFFFYFYSLADPILNYFWPANLRKDSFGLLTYCTLASFD